jgi:hypothetical protein
MMAARTVEDGVDLVEGGRRRQLAEVDLLRGAGGKG